MARPNRRYSREITCDFFRVQLGQNGSDNFLDAMNSFQARCNQATVRNLSTEDGYVRLHNWQTIDGEGSGALLRLRTDGGTRIAQIDTDDLRDLSLSANEALADFSCFKYFAEFQTLVVHRNRDAGNESRLRYYLEQKGTLRPLSFELLVSTNALQRFARLQEITVAEIQIALPEDLGAETSGGNVSVGQAISLARRSKAATFTTRFSMGHSRRRKMDMPFIKQFIQETIEQQGDRVHAAEIKGRMESGEDVQTIDLIRDRMREKVRLDTGEARPTLADFYETLSKAYRNRRQEISQQFRAR